MRKNLETVKLGAFDDLQRPPANPFHPADQLAGITPVGPDPGQPGKQIGRPEQEKTCAVPILNVGFMDYDQKEQTQFINQDMPLPARFFLPASYPCGPTTSVV